ncbi:MAG: serine hydrolase, partial [Muribaculaceae bacterium]|nr:serine hydrolase [Muribaculaceae bacterium]
YLLIFLIFFNIVGCSSHSSVTSHENVIDKIQEIVDTVPGEVGIAFFYTSSTGERDSILINNDTRYALMSVFKLHEAIAVINKLENDRTSIDSTIWLKRDNLDANTWSPMLTDYKEPKFGITIRDLLRYAITQSDNNASNILFEHIISPQKTNQLLKSILSDTDFNISCSEKEMQKKHELCFENYSSPASAALLIEKVFEDSLISEKNQYFLQDLLLTSTIGQDRIGTPVSKNDKIRFGHKTGSGYRNENGELLAYNDVGYFDYPDKYHYTLAVFIKNYKGPESQASEIMANISTVLYNYVNSKIPQ